MAAESRGHRFGWTGEMASPNRTDQMEYAITLARNFSSNVNKLSSQAEGLLEAGQESTAAQIGSAICQIIEALLDLLYRNKASAGDIADVLLDLARTYEMVGSRSEANAVAQLARATYDMQPGYASHPLIEGVNALIERTAR